MTETVGTKNKWNVVLQNISYDFDRVGNVSGYTNVCTGSVNGSYSTKQSYSYDGLYQLVLAEGETVYNPHKSVNPEFTSTYRQEFSFDQYGLGNMTAKKSSETVSPNKKIGDDLNYTFKYVYDDSFAHRLVSIGNRYYQYDSNGNVTVEQDGSFDGETAVYGRAVDVDGNGVKSTDYGWGLFKDTKSASESERYKRVYTWDERNRLIASSDSTYTVSYLYSQDGERTNKYTLTSETLYFSKMWTLHTDAGNATEGGQTSKHIYLGDTRIVTKLNSGTNPTYSEEYNRQYYYHADHLGSAHLITDKDGNEYQRLEYTPYGEIWVEKTSNTGLEYLPYKFTGKEMDSETGLYYYGARYLDPKYSRWLSTDPALGDYIPQAPISDEAKKHNQNLPGMGGVFNHINGNLYHYGGNNPVKYTDPDGNALHILIGAGVGAAISISAQIIGDISTGTNLKVSNLVGAAVGGAVAGGILAATGNVAAANMGASCAGAALGNLTKQAVAIAFEGQEEFNSADFAKDMVVGVATNFTPGVFSKLKGLGAGRNSIKAVGEAAATKLRHGVIQSVSAKTSLKMAGGRLLTSSFVEGTAAATVSNSVLIPKGQETLKSATQKTSEVVENAEKAFLNKLSTSLAGGALF